MNSLEKLKQEILKKDKQVSELYVLIDTLQSNLRSAITHLEDGALEAVNNHSCRWCIKWRPGDEKK